MSKRHWFAAVVVTMTQLLGIGGALGTVYPGSVSGSLEQWLPVTLTVDTQYAISMTGSSGVAGYAGFYLFDSTKAHSIDSGNAYSTASTRSPNALKAGSYWIKVWCNNSSANGTYTITTTEVAAPLTNDGNSNVTKSAALAATLEAASTGHIGYLDGNTHNWEDWWTITLPSDGLLSLDFVISGKSDLFLAYSGYYLFSANDKTMDSTMSLAGSRTPVSVKAGTYYLKLWVNGTYEYASYSLTPRLSAAPLANDSEQNDSKANAKDATLNAANTGHIGYDADSHDWEDWWKITLSSDDTLTLNFETSGVSSSFTASAGYYLFDSSDSTKLSGYFTTPPSTGSAVLKAGTYYLKLWINSAYQYGSYSFTPSLKSGQSTATTTSTTTTTSATSTTSTTSTSTTTSTTTTTTLGGTSGTTNLLSLGAWNIYGTASMSNGTLTMGDFVGYDTADSDKDGNPYNTWNAGSASGGSGGDYDEAVTVQEFARPLKLSWTGCFPETSLGYNNIFLGRKNTAFRNEPNNKQYPISQEFGFSTSWEITGLNTKVSGNGASDLQRVTAATAASAGYCADYSIEWWADDMLKFYYNGTLVREQTYAYVGPVSVLVRSFDKPHTFTTMIMEALTSSAADTLAPTVPGSLTAIAGSSSQITLSWAASSDAVGVTAYKVYRGGALITTLGNVTTYSDTGLAASTTYSYTIAACDAASNCSAQSSSASATTQQGTSTSTDSKSDCLFNWAELQYGALFSPRAQSLSFGPYYLRFYSQTNSYLAVTSNSFVYLGPLSGNQLLEIGSATTWYANAGCN